MTIPTWPELIGLMSAGEARETPFSGILEVDGWYSGDHRSETLPNTVRVFKWRARYRVETLSGEVLFIRGADRAWRFPRSSHLPIVAHRPDGRYDRCFGSYAVAIDRPRPGTWLDPDPEADAVRVTGSVYLGRPSWDVVIPDPAAAAGAAHLTIDAATGMLLRRGSALLGDDFRWTRFADLPAVDDSRFAWDGDVADEDARVVDEEPVPAPVARPGSSGRRPITPLSVTLTGQPEIFELTDDGSFHLGYDLGGFVSVFRRPHDASVGPVVDEREGWTTWTDDGWDWSIKLPAGLHPDQVAAIRQQLRRPAEPRHDHA
ncbi:MAG: hypothetical protein ABWX74_04680 [Aeromicrobium sp.]